jgi:glycosyltransferase involved in cell wall biosynthesis
MRVLYHHRTQGRGVEAVHIMGVVNGLKALGYEVEIMGPPGVDTNPDVVVAAEKGQTGTIWGKIARSLPQALFECMEIGYNLVAIPRVWKRCRSLKPVFVYERYSTFNLTGAVVCRLTHTPFVLEVNDTVGVDRTRAGKAMKMKGLARVFERYAFRNATGIVVVSGFLQDQVMNTGVSEARICVSANAVDADQFSRENANAEAVRKRYNLVGKTVVGFAGSFTKWHRVDLLIRAFAALAGDMSDLRLLLVGDGTLKEESEQLARDLGIEDRVIFTGKAPHADMPDYMGAMDMGVMPESNPFGSPMKVFEYMSMECPPVAPRYGPLVEAFDDGVEGMLFEPQNVEGLTRCLRTLATDSQFRGKLARAARERVLTRHLWVHNAQAAVDLAYPFQRAPVAAISDANDSVTV